MFSKLGRALRHVKQVRLVRCWREKGTTLYTIIIHQIFLLTRDWPKHVTWPNIPQLKLGNIREYSPIFKTARVAKKIWRIIKTIVAIWGENMLGYLSVGHYLFLVAHSFPRASLSENCSLLGTDNVRGQISEHIFAPNGDYCLFILNSRYIPVVPCS